MSRTISNILFVCTGNTCRSAFAQGLFTKIATQKEIKGYTADSAGLVAVTGNSATFLAQRVASEYGVDLTEHKSKPLTKKLIDWADLILIMEKSHIDTLLADFPEAEGRAFLIRHFANSGSGARGISDPYGLRYDAYRFCFLDIKDAVSYLIKHIERHK